MHNPGLTYKKVESVFKYTTGEGFRRQRKARELFSDESKQGFVKNCKEILFTPKDTICRFTSVKYALSRKTVSVPSKKA